MGTKKEETPRNGAPQRSKLESSASSGFALGQEPVVGADPEIAKYEVAPGPEPEKRPTPSAPPAFDDLGELPGTYDENTLFCTARDPRWLFCYWDFDWTKI